MPGYGVAIIVNTKNEFLVLEDLKDGFFKFPAIKFNSFGLWFEYNKLVGFVESGLDLLSIKDFFQVDFLYKNESLDLNKPNFFAYTFKQNTGKDFYWIKKGGEKLKSHWKKFEDLNFELWIQYQQVLFFREDKPRRIQNKPINQGQKKIARNIELAKDLHKKGEIQNCIDQLLDISEILKFNLSIDQNKEALIEIENDLILASFCLKKTHEYKRGNVYVDQIQFDRKCREVAFSLTHIFSGLEEFTNTVVLKNTSSKLSYAKQSLYDGDFKSSISSIEKVDNLNESVKGEVLQFRNRYEREIIKEQRNNTYVFKDGIIKECILARDLLETINNYIQ